MYLILDARYEKMRHGGVVRDFAVLSAIGIGPDERLGVSVALSEAEVHWRVRRENSPPDCLPILLTLESLVARVARGRLLPGFTDLTPPLTAPHPRMGPSSIGKTRGSKRGCGAVSGESSTARPGIHRLRRPQRPARRPACRSGWQRCQFHPARNAIHHAPSAETAGRIGKQLKSIWTAEDIGKAETALAELVASYRDTASKLADWLEQNVPEGLAVFTLPEHHRRRLRTSNPIERSVQQELKRRTVKVRVFPGEDALLRLVSAVLVEIDEKWASDTKAYLKWECQDA